MAKRKPKIEKTKIDILKPVDIFALGTADDPCFGKHHSLKAPECMTCGDSEFCSIVTAQNLHKIRLEVESTQQMKDLDEAEEIEVNKIKKAKELLIKYKSNGHKRLKVIFKVAEQCKLTKDKVKELYNQI